MLEFKPLHASMRDGLMKGVKIIKGDTVMMFLSSR